ncbi:hypothetical protein LC608_19005 [Nostoc sp. XA010]|uniref:hypothetical protein n=1 Tax=Nostoc sp. XA010 TaxID=2780407 RepID=UPI001E44B620|nr:hypothetical protein [Nostoc sp. XA010]MCC5659025.1 hypothetical protein [Nostoc sp. XA010]
MQIIQNFFNVNFKPLVREKDLFLSNRFLLRKSRPFLSANIPKPLVTMKAMKLSSFAPMVKHPKLFPKINRRKLLNEWDINEWDSEMPFIIPEPLEAIRQEAEIQNDYPLEGKTIAFTNNLPNKVETRALNQQTETKPQKSAKKSQNPKQKAKSKSTKKISPVTKSINYSFDEVSASNHINTDDAIKVPEYLSAVANPQVLDRLNVSDVQHIPALLEDIESSSVNVNDTETIPIAAKKSIQANEGIEIIPIPEKSIQASKNSDLKLADINTQDSVKSEVINSEKNVGQSYQDTEIQRKILTNSTDILSTKFIPDETFVVNHNPNLSSEIGLNTIESEAAQTKLTQKVSTTLINKIAETQEITDTHSRSDESLREHLEVNPNHNIGLSPNTQNQITPDFRTQLQEKNTPQFESDIRKNISNLQETKTTIIGEESAQKYSILEKPSLLTQDNKSTIGSNKEEIEKIVTVTKSLPTEILSELVNSGYNTLPKQNNDIVSELVETLPQQKDETTFISTTANTEIKNTRQILPTEPQSGSLIANSIDPPPLDIDLGTVIPKPTQITPTSVEYTTSNSEDKTVVENQVVSANNFLSTQEKADISIENKTLVSELFDNNGLQKLPTPQGFAVGGEVEVSANLVNQQIAPSDIVPAMLTPGEFVVKATVAQKNLNLLHHINSGGNAESLAQISTQPLKVQRKEENSTKVDTDKPAEEQNLDIGLATVFKSLNPSADLLNSEQKDISIFRSIQSDKFNAKTVTNSPSSTKYSSVPLIFRQKNSTPYQSSINSTYDEITQWSSVEELLNENNQDENLDNFTLFNFADVPFHRNEPKVSDVSESTNNLVHKYPIQHFADGGEVTAPTKITNTDLQPITETIKQFASNSDNANIPDLENLAREIYTRLRQRLEIERERHGMYSGRLPW